MVRAGYFKMSMFCLSKIRPHVRARSPSSALECKVDVNSSRSDHPEVEVPGGETGLTTSTFMMGRKIMIVVDSSIEAKHALQWGLTHSVQSQDIVILLHVAKPNSKRGEGSGKGTARKAPDFLCSMKNMCQLKRPEVKVEITMVEGKDKGPTIVEEAKKQEVALLVLGLKKQSMTWRLLMTWAGSRVGSGVVEQYCIQNAACMAVAVRRKSKKAGGYLITTKKQKDFWLLA